MIQGNTAQRKIVLLSGGVGGARLARGFSFIPEVDLTTVVNVGDDDHIYGLYVSPDIDTVLYTLAGTEGPAGWGVGDDSFVVLDRLASFGIDTTFRIGDLDLAVHLYRSYQLGEGWPLSLVTDRLREAFGLAPAVLPATNDPIRTKIRTDDGNWRSFQEYFVLRGHRDTVRDVRFDGAEKAAPAPGVTEAIKEAEAVVIGPSNPPLSIWPILAVPEIGRAVESAGRVIGISPLFGGKALKGPADRVLASLDYPPGNEGVVAGYPDLLTDFVIDTGDAADRRRLATPGLEIHVADTRIAEPADARRFAAWLLDLP